MSIQNSRYYRPSEGAIWKNWDVITCLDCTRDALPENGICLIGFVSDEGVQRNNGRIGAAEGPAAFRKKCGRLPRAFTPRRAVYDLGDIVCIERDLEGAQEALGHLVAACVAKGCFPLVIGGGHEMAWGHFQGLRSKAPAICNFDAHFDLRPLPDGRGNSGTPFTQIADECAKMGAPFSYFCFGIQPLGNSRALFEESARRHVRYVPAHSFYEGDQAGRLLETAIAESECIYCTVCLDVFAAPFAPGVSAPQSLGLLPWHVLRLVRRLVSSGKVVGFDIAELNPAFDCDAHTAQLASYLALNVIECL